MSESAQPRNSMPHPSAAASVLAYFAPVLVYVAHTLLDPASVGNYWCLSVRTVELEEVSDVSWKRGQKMLSYYVTESATEMLALTQWIQKLLHDRSLEL